MTRTISAVVTLMCALSISAQTLPPGPGKELVLNACVQCHDLRWVVSQQKSETAWRRTVNEMVWRGAPLVPGDVGVITRYLSNGVLLPSGEGAAKRRMRGAQASSPLTRRSAPRSPDGRGTSVDESKLPPGPGRNLVIATCVQCHDLGVTTSQRKTADEWRRSVERMAHLGAKLNGREMLIVSEYLAREFGR